MSFPYTIGLPNPPDDPSQDVGGMQINTNTIDSWVQVDHVGFRNSLGGKHQTVTFPVPQSDPSLSINTTQIYPKTFGSAPTYLETYAALNTSAGVQINGYMPFVKAMAQFVVRTTPGVCTLNIVNTIKVNVASVTFDGAKFIVAFETTMNLPYPTYQVFPNTLQRTVTGDYTFRTTGRTTSQFQLFLGNGSLITGDIIGFMVI